MTENEIKKTSCPQTTCLQTLVSAPARKISPASPAGCLAQSPEHNSNDRVNKLAKFKACAPTFLPAMVAHLMLKPRLANSWQPVGRQRHHSESHLRLRVTSATKHIIGRIFELKMCFTFSNTTHCLGRKARKCAFDACLNKCSRQSLVQDACYQVPCPMFKTQLQV